MAEDAFQETGATATEAPPEPTTPEPEAPAAEGGEPAASEPDLAEQQAAIERRLDAAGIPQPPAEDATLSPDQFIGALAGEPVEPEQAEGGIDPELLQQLLGDQQGLEPQAETPQQDPRIDQVIDYLTEREERENTKALNSFASENPDIRKPEVLEEVIVRTTEFAERAGDPNLRSDPFVVEQAYKAVMADRAEAAEVPAAEARNQGAPLETDAGASAAEGETSYEDQAKAELRAAGGTAFPS